ncbi:hypothetical protein [Vreelandella populi]|uniref:hypothetical protein n=1 Tax=Vreelandella populi TaxID=2498858 RepID=UPI000F8CE0B6|nr:hypothetical protein [Halomonas populi]RUR51489.1 hypothetical protein ELY40_16980 [Halomonas populi]
MSFNHNLILGISYKSTNDAINVQLLDPETKDLLEIITLHTHGFTFDDIKTQTNSNLLNYGDLEREKLHYLADDLFQKHGKELVNFFIGLESTLHKENLYTFYKNM